MSGSSQDGGGGIFTLIANHISAVKHAKTIVSAAKRIVSVPTVVRK
jgi:hypothetical protein